MERHFNSTSFKRIPYGRTSKLNVGKSCKSVYEHIKEYEYTVMIFKS